MPARSPSPAPAPSSPAPAAPLVPRLTLLTLSRGDGLLGLRARDGFGPRSAQLSAVHVDWTYTTPQGVRWETPAPGDAPSAARVLAPVVLRSGWTREEFRRDAAAEAVAHAALRSTGLRPLPPDLVQWRHASAAEGHGQLWTLPEENHFGDWFAEQAPRLQALGHELVVRPGFAHQSVPVAGWKLVVDPERGEALGHTPTTPIEPHGRRLGRLRSGPREGSWLLSLGVEIDVDGRVEVLDLAPMLADLLKRDPRWLDAEAIAGIADDARIKLRAPGGRRIEAPAGPLKAIVGAMVDLLLDPRRDGEPIRVDGWDAPRLGRLQDALAASMAGRAGERGAWALQGADGLQSLARRLRAAGPPAPIDEATWSALALGGDASFVLRDYQRHGVAWLQALRTHDLSGILADDMGLGKTAQVLAHLRLEQQAGRLDVPALVVVPTSLLANWQAEAARIAPQLRLLTLHGARRQQQHEAIATHDLVLTTYPLLWRDLDALRAREWHLLILDEAQTVKNASSRAALAARRLQARHRLAVTGTPIENHLGELWTHFDLLMPGFLGDARGFARRWRKPIEENGETVRAALLAARVRPFILRRRKDDVATELPPKTTVVRRVALVGQQRALYESVRVAADKQVRRALARSGFDGAQIAVLDALLKLRQVCCDPHLVKGPALPAGMERAKLEWLEDALPQMVDEGRRVLLFSQFTEMLGLVRERLDALALPHLMLTGDTPAGERGSVVERFQALEVPLLLLSLRAGGVGLNLTAADTVIHLDPWWNPAVERQATDRAHRIGQERPVFVYQLVAAGSIEERMLVLQARKAALAEGVLGEDAGRASKFDEAELEGLLAPLPHDEDMQAREPRDDDDDDDDDDDAAWYGAALDDDVDDGRGEDDT